MTDPVPSKEPLCGHCRLPIHPSDSRRHFGFYTAHGDGRCVQLLQMEIDRLQTALRGISTCSSCEACRGAATRALGGTEPRPSHEREPPHCSSCSCGMTPEACAHPWDKLGISAEGKYFCAECNGSLVKDPPWVTIPSDSDDLPEDFEFPTVPVECTSRPPYQTWQPIETAPKDGTPILGYVLPPRMQPSLEGPRVVKWIGEASMWSMPGISGLTCSHWMPLPAGPAQPPGDGQ